MKSLHFDETRDSGGECVNFLPVCVAVWRSGGWVRSSWGNSSPLPAGPCSPCPSRPFPVVLSARFECNRAQGAVPGLLHSALHRPPSLLFSHVSVKEDLLELNRSRAHWQTPDTPLLAHQSQLSTTHPPTPLRHLTSVASKGEWKEWRLFLILFCFISLQQSGNRDEWLIFFDLFDKQTVPEKVQKTWGLAVGRAWEDGLMQRRGHLVEILSGHRLVPPPAVCF